MAIVVGDKDIKLAYLSKARQYHPDVCEDEDSKEKFQKISQVAHGFIRNLSSAF